MGSNVRLTDLVEDELTEMTVTSVRSVPRRIVGSSFRPPVLKQVSGPGAPVELVLDADELVIGRSRAVDFRVDSSEVSRRHVRLRRQGGEIAVEDLRSHNGTYLNGLKIRSATLRDGDLIQIGNVVFLFREGR